MTKRQVWRYRCEYCKKSGYSAGHMRNHETHCTMNPQRICRMHLADVDYFGGPQPPISDLLAALKVLPIEAAMSQLREVSGECPACMLAAIRQSGIDKWDGDPDNAPPALGFDFKAEMKAAWNGINDASGV